MRTLIGAVSKGWAIMGFYKTKKIAQAKLLRAKNEQLLTSMEFPEMKKYEMDFKIEKKGDVYVIYSKLKK